MTEATCQVPDCETPIKRASYCYSHYMKNWRYGTPTPEHPPTWVDIRGQRFGSLVVVERKGRGWACACDCGQTTTVLAGDLNRGTVTTCGDKAIHWRRDDIGYGMAHERVPYRPRQGADARLR